jgi:hypothetical protein
MVGDAIRAAVPNVISNPIIVPYSYAARDDNNGIKGGTQGHVLHITASPAAAILVNREVITVDNVVPAPINGADAINRPINANGVVATTLLAASDDAATMIQMRMS